LSKLPRPIACRRSRPPPSSCRPAGRMLSARRPRRRAGEMSR
jgi:hypothetical protein